MSKRAKRTISLTRFDAVPFFPTIADCRRWTEVLNHIMFNGRVPKYRKISIRSMRKTYAWCIGGVNKRGKRYCELEINKKFDSFAAFYSILAHELCHSAEHHELGEMSHGKFFYSHREMLQLFGIKLKNAY